MFLKTLRWPMIVIGLTAFIGLAEARDRQWEASPSVWSLYNQGYVNQACWEAYHKDRQWRWMLWCANEHGRKGDTWSAEQFYGNAHTGALDWAEHGTESWRVKKGCDRHWGIMGLQAVVNYTGAGLVPLIRQQANNNLGRITSQNPPNVLHGPWVVPLGGRLTMRQYGAGFDSSFQNLAGGRTNIVYNRNAPFRIWDATWSTGSYWWYNYSSAGALQAQGRGVVWVNNNDTCTVQDSEEAWDPLAKKYGNPYNSTWTRP